MKCVASALSAAGPLLINGWPSLQSIAAAAEAQIGGNVIGGMCRLCAVSYGHEMAIVAHCESLCNGEMASSRGLKLSCSAPWRLWRHLWLAWLAGTPREALAVANGWWPS